MYLLLHSILIVSLIILVPIAIFLNLYIFYVNIYVIFIKKGVNKQMYFLTRVLVTFRGIVNLILNFITIIAIIGGIICCCNHSIFTGIIAIIVGIISYAIKVYYDKLILKVKPDDIDVTLPR